MFRPGVRTIYTQLYDIDYVEDVERKRHFCALMP